MRKSLTCTKTNPLHKQIGEIEKYLIEELKVSGFLSDEDYAFLTEMCQEGGRLRKLDLFDVNETETETSFENSDGIIVYKMKEDETVIPGNVFQNCVRLEEIIFPAHLTAIGDYSFMYCENLREVNFPETLEYLFYQTFYHCSKLNEVYLPNNPFVNNLDCTFAGGVQKFRYKIDKWPFDKKGDYISILDGFFSFEGVLFYDFNNVMLYKYPSYNTDTYYEVPLGTDEIHTGAFWECKYLKTIIINGAPHPCRVAAGSWITLFESAIIDCPNLERIVIKSDCISLCRFSSFNMYAGSPIVNCPKLRDIYLFSDSPQEVEFIFLYLKGIENIVLHVPRLCAGLYRNYDVLFDTIQTSAIDDCDGVVSYKAWNWFKRIEEFDVKDLMDVIYADNM